MAKLRRKSGEKGIEKDSYDEDLSASTVLVDKATDLERWRLLDERGCQTWHYLQSDEEVEAWPQSIADRHHLGLDLVCVYWLFRFSFPINLSVGPPEVCKANDALDRCPQCYIPLCQFPAATW